MNPFQRVMATVMGESVDRRPIAPVLSLYGAHLTNCPLENYYTHSDAYVAGQCAAYETFQPDVIFGPFCVPIEGLPFGSQIKYYDNLPPNLVKPALRGSSQTFDYSVEQLLEHPAIKYLEESVNQLQKSIGGEVPIVPILLSPLDLPVMMMGIENWLQGLLFEEECAKAVLELTVPYFVERCNRLFDMGVPFVVISGIFVNPSILTRDIVESTAKPILTEAFSQLNGPVILHSGGAPLVPFLDLLNRLPKVAGFVINPDEDFLQARQKVGPQPVLDGNIDGPNLHLHTAEDIYKQCTALLEQTNNDPHVLLGTSGADIRPETPIENIQAMLQAAKDFGGNE